jgi:CheY-like chemotaxis protein
MAQKILIVDDEQDIRSLYAAALERAGFSVTLAEGGTQALAAVEQNPPDLILLDETMPGIGGHAAQQQLRAAPATAHIPVVFLTAFSNPASLARDNDAFLKESGAKGFIKKGISLDEFVQEVKKYLSLGA